MEDVVALKARKIDGSFVAVLAWGRIFHPIDPTELIDAFKESLHMDAELLDEAVLCDSLAEVSHFKYFYEGLLSFAMKPIPFGPGYDAWRDEKRREYATGCGDFFLLGEVLGDETDVSKFWQRGDAGRSRRG